MRILIMADSHGDTSRFGRAVEMTMPDVIIHLGDIERDAEYLEAAFPDIPIEAVSGNNDFYSSRPREKVLTLCGLNIFITHGHAYSVYSGAERLAERAEALGCALALYAHTHIAADRTYSSVRAFNPGSISRPRAGKRSVGILEIEDNGKYGLVHCDWI